MAVEKPNLVHLEIFGQTYAVHAGNNDARLQEIAALVDAEMREVGRSAGAVDSVRIAVLAALNIADENLRLRAQVRDMEKLAEARAGALARELGSVLGE